LPRIVSASAPEFGYAAAQAVATWRFTRPERKGKPGHRARADSDQLHFERGPAARGAFAEVGAENFRNSALPRVAAAP
jgi:hypothetical protein